MKRAAFLTIMLTTIFLLGLPGRMIFGQIPQTMSYQGILTDGSGNPVSDGSYNLTFKLYDVSTSGSALWTETQSVTTSSGLFNVILGSVTSLNCAFDKPYWLGITVGTGSELSPRIELAASAYSLNARGVLGSANVFPSDGSVGIDTTSPGAKLHVAGVPGVDGIMFPDGTLQTTAAGGSAADGDWTVSGSNIYSAVSGNVGIGTSSPQRKLHLAKSDHVTLVLEDTGAGTDAKKKFINTDNGKINLGKFTDGWTFTPQMTIDDTGRVGIGTTNPSHTLHVIRYSDSPNYQDPAIFGQHYSDDYANEWGIGIKGVGGSIGVLGEVNKFHGGTYMGVMGSVTGINNDGWAYGVYGSATASSLFRYGVYGTATPGVLGGTAVYADGDLAYTGSLINASDAKFKQNIQPFTGAVSKLMRLRTTSFEFSNNPGFSHINLATGKQYGFIAQELEEVFPELVVHMVHPPKLNSEGEEIGEPINYKGVKISGLIPILVQAIQEQQKTIEELQIQIARLQSR